MCDARYKRSLPAFVWRSNHGIKGGAAKGYVMLNDGIASAAHANMAVEAVSETVDVGLTASLSWQGKGLLRPADKLLDAPDVAVVEVDDCGVLYQGA